MRKIIGISINLVLALLIFCSPGLAQALHIAVPTDPDSFDPSQTVAAATGEIAFNIYEGLVKATPEGKVEGALAAHWDLDQSGTVYTFYLREAVFHDGSPLTVFDVVNALDRARDPEIAVRAGELEVIEEITALDGAVRIQLKEPHGAFLYALAEVFAVIYPAQARDLARNPVGTGPYSLREWHPNQQLVLESFQEHWSGRKPYYQQVVFQIIPDENSMVLNLKAGRVDLIPRLEISTLHQVEGDQNLQVLAAPMNLVQLFALNNKRAPFDDLRVRKALALAVNKEEVLLGAAWGQGQILHSGLSPAMPQFYNPDLGSVNPYDPQKARALLREAGQENLKFTLVLPANYPLHIAAGELVAEQWKAVGIKVNLEIVEWGTWLEKVYNQRDYEVSVIGLAGRLDPHAILARYQSDNSRNFFNFANAEYDRLIAAGLQAAGEERIQIYKKAQQILAEEVAGIFIMDPPQLSVMSKEIKGWKHYPVYVVDAASLYE
ncbi:MAG: ABC transporter substrate-binding protein [Firmicutes bacterium]|nr:ABC transporter substrate-binding protein [Bacillota bacterium]